MRVPTMIHSNLGSPASPAWANVEKQSVPLGAVALEKQPTAYIREAWAAKPYAQTKSVDVAAASDGERLYVRLEWADDARPNGEFQDAAGAMFGSGALATMGDESAPLDLWYWEHGRDAALNLSSRGPGVVTKQDNSNVDAHAALNGGRWSVVLSGPAASAASGRLGVAVWNGSNDERAGLGAVSQDWLALELD